MRWVDGTSRRCLLAIVSVALVAGCSAGQQVPSTPTNVPTFQGPWASEFDTLYRASTSDLQRDVLADGQITELEVSQLQDSFSSCISGKGLKLTWTTDGGFDIDEAGSAEDSNAAVKECNRSTIGQVLGLYYEMQRNPQRLDEATIMAACLVKQGLVPAGYTAADFTRDSQSNPPASFLESAKSTECARDPLGLKK